MLKNPKRSSFLALRLPGNWHAQRNLLPPSLPGTSGPVSVISACLACYLCLVDGNQPRFIWSLDQLAVNFGCSRHFSLVSIGPGKFSVKSGCTFFSLSLVFIPLTSSTPIKVFLDYCTIFQKLVGFSQRKHAFTNYLVLAKMSFCVSKNCLVLRFNKFSWDSVAAVTMAQFVNAKKAENIPVLSGCLVLNW